MEYMEINSSAYVICNNEDCRMSGPIAPSAAKAREEYNRIAGIVKNAAKT